MFEIKSRIESKLSREDLLEHLRYQNNLLVERNKMLALENNKLLDQLAQIKLILSQTETIKTKEIIQENAKIKHLFHQSFSKWSHMFKQKHKPYFQKLNDCLVKMNSTLDDKNGSILILFQSMRSIIQSLYYINNQKEDKSTKSKLSAFEDRLKLRKAAYHQTQKLIHFVKDPCSVSIEQHSTKVFDEDLTATKQFYEKIIRRVKKNQINIRTIQLLYQKFEQITKYKRHLRQTESKLKIIERQIELGFIDTDIHQSTIAKIKQYRQDINIAKRTLDRELSIIC